jgi:hypothetical protein
MIIKFNHPTRRAAIMFLVTAGVAASSMKLRAEGQPAATVYKDPSCSCCSGWARHLTAAGFTVTVIETKNVSVVKARLGVPDELASCHTAEIGGYAIEGHVPAPAIMRLLRERPIALMAALSSEKSVGHRQIVAIRNRNMAERSPCAQLPVGSSGRSFCAGKLFRPFYPDTTELDITHSLHELSHDGMGRLRGVQAHVEGRHAALPSRA